MGFYIPHLSTPIMFAPFVKSITIMHAQGENYIFGGAHVNFE